MSGLFRYNSNSRANRPTSLNSFCFSNQDAASMDGSYTFGYRSPSTTNAPILNNGPNGPLSPTHGRSLREYDEKLQALRKENFNLKLKIYFLEEKSPCSTDINLKVEIEGLRNDLREKQDLLVQAANAMSLLEESENKLRETNAELNKKIEELQNEIFTIKHPNVNEETAECHDIGDDLPPNTSQYEELQSIIKENEQEIDKLSEELKCASQRLVDRDTLIASLEQELNEFKNRSLHTGESLEHGNISAKSNNIDELQAQILSQKQKLADKVCIIQDLEEKLAAKSRVHDNGCKTIQLLLIKTRELDAEIERLKSHDEKTTASDSINDLKAELSAAKEEVKQEKRWRNECADVCSVLTVRLNELAGFLDSLLKHKDVLSVLAQDSHKAMRKAVDNSLDLSRSITMSSQGRFSLNEKSLMQISSITDVLNDSYFADRDLRNDLNAVNSSTVDRLRDEIKALRFDLERTRSISNVNKTENATVAQHERSFRNLSQCLEMNSDSEEQWSEPDRKVSHERIGLETSAMNTSNFKLKPSSSSPDDDNSVLLMRKNSSLRLQEKVNDLESQITAKNKQLSKLEETITLNNKDITTMKMKIVKLSDELDNWKQLRNKSEASLEEIRNEMAQMQNDYVNKINENEQLLTNQKTVNNDLRMELDKLKLEIDVLEKLHAEQNNEMIAREAEKWNSIRRELYEQYQKDLEHEMLVNNEMIARDMVKRIDFDEQIHRNEELEKRLIEMETLLQMVQNNENELNKQIDDKEKTLRDLKRNLDEVTLQQSKAVLERTKFMNERDHFEKLSREINDKYEQLSNESSELHTKLAKLSHENAQLHSKLVINETQFQLTRSASQGNARYTLTSPKSRSHQYSGNDQSDYTSDEMRHRLENSSPDLGIESDGTGRSSGTDANAAQSPTLNVRQSNKSDLDSQLSNILMEGEEEIDLEKSTQQTPNKLPKSPLIIFQHDCEMAEKENTELRRKLERTRRAFEKTWAQLRISNQRKEQIEKDIRQEIYKTHSVLKNVRSNIENANHPIDKSSLHKNSHMGTE